MDFRQRLEQSRVHPIDHDSPDESENHVICPYFATDRSKTPICLDIRLANGNRKAVPYSYFMEISFDVETGIEILTTQKRIRIVGRNLITLFDHLVTYRVRYVQANIGHDMEEDGVFVEAIRIEEL